MQNSEVEKIDLRDMVVECLTRFEHNSVYDIGKRRDSVSMIGWLKNYIEVVDSYNDRYPEEKFIKMIVDKYNSCDEHYEVVFSEHSHVVNLINDKNMTELAMFVPMNPSYEYVHFVKIVERLENGEKKIYDESFYLNVSKEELKQIISNTESVYDDVTGFYRDDRFKEFFCE